MLKIMLIGLSELPSRPRLCGWETERIHFGIIDFEPESNAIGFGLFEPVQLAVSRRCSDRFGATQSFAGMIDD